MVYSLIWFSYLQYCMVQCRLHCCTSPCFTYYTIWKELSQYKCCLLMELLTELNENNLFYQLSANKFKIIINLIQDGPFRSCSRMRGPRRPPLSKICYTYPAIVRLGRVIPCLKKLEKIYESHGTSVEFRWDQHFLPEINKYSYIKKCRWRLTIDA